MKKNILLVVFMVFAFIIIFNYSDYNLKRTISACLVGQKQTSDSFDLEKAKKFCEEKIKKEKE